MTKRARAKRILSVATACIGVSCASTASDAAAPRILVFSKTEGFRHASISSGVQALQELGEHQGVRVEATEDASVFERDALAEYAAVVFLSTTGDVLDAAQQDALTAYVRAGGGFAGVHSASDTEYDWPWYGRLVGAYFDGHPSDPNVRRGVLRVAEPRHPATEGLPDPWVRSDEWYDLRNLGSDMTVLLDIEEDSYKGPDEDPAADPRPIAWYHEFDGGRAFYTALGHTPESYAEPAFLEHLWGGITMVIGPRPPPR